MAPSCLHCLLVLEQLCHTTDIASHPSNPLPLRPGQDLGICPSVQPLQALELSKAARQDDPPAIEDIQVLEVDQMAKVLKLLHFVLPMVQLHLACKTTEMPWQSIYGRTEIQDGGLWDGLQPAP